MVDNTIAKKHPELIDEWDYELNTNSPDVITCGVMTKVHWICRTCNHRWTASVYSRCHKGQGCPECAKKKRGRSKTLSVAQKNNFALQFPDMAKEWHPTKNGDWKPEMVSVSCNRQFWWICPKCGNEYTASVNHRTAYNSGCHRCAYKENGANCAKKAAKKNNFAEKYPYLALEWDYEANNGFRPEDFSVSSNYPAHWICSYCGNKWTISINKRTSNHGCPACTKTGSSFSEQAILYYVRKVFPTAAHRYENRGVELDVFIPEISTAIEYDGVFYHKSKKALEKENNKDRICKDQQIRLIRIRDPKLPDTECAERITCIDDQKQDNLGRALEQLLFLLKPQNGIQVNLRRDYADINALFRNSVKDNSIAILRPDLLAFWHPTKNLPLTPDKVTKGMKISPWWHCPKCNQDYQQDLNHKVNGRGCPICAGKKVVAGYNDIATLFPHLAEEWDYEANGDLRPEQFTKGSGKKVNWICREGHKWPAVISSRAKENGAGCRFCSKKKKNK